MSSSHLSPSRPRIRPVQQPELEGLDTDTWAIWVIALLPLASIVVNLLPLPIVPPTGPAPDPGGIALYVLSITVSVAFVVAEVLLAATDRRILVGRGVIRPMHWGWAFLDLVYIIGRFVVVRRRVRGSLRPLAVWGVAFALMVVLNELPR